MGSKKLSGALIIPYPITNDSIDEPNAFVINEVSDNSGYVGAQLVAFGQNREADNGKHDQSGIGPFYQRDSHLTFSPWCDYWDGHLDASESQKLEAGFESEMVR